MKRWKRKTILILALFVFIVIAPTIILYSSGYRYDFDEKSIRKVGMIIIESIPRDVDIFMNDKLVASNTSHKIRNLFLTLNIMPICKMGFNFYYINYAQL